MQKKLVAACIVAVAFSACVKEINPNKEEGSDPLLTSESTIVENLDDEFVPGELLVKFKSGQAEKGLQNALAKTGGKLKEKIVTKAMQSAGDNEGIYLLQVPYGLSVALQKAKGMQEVEIAEPNYVYRRIEPTADANDYYYYENEKNNLWGMMGDLTTPAESGYGCRAAEVWSGASGKDGSNNVIYNNPKQTGSKDIYIAVIDEGIDYNHEDLSDNIWKNPGEIANNNIDDDGNGYVDDVYGYDFANNKWDVNIAGENAHGTHVAGTIGAVGNNEKGVAGVCWQVTIISAKFMTAKGGTTANAIKAIDYVTDLKKTKGINMVATNNSWGGGAKSTLLQNAIERSNAANILFIASAGNNGMNTDRFLNYPSCYPNTNIISVASIWVDGTKSSFSNYGAKTVDIYAPGSNIISTTPNNTYTKYSGTSMAAPHVTGAVAMYASIHAGKTAAQIKDAIFKSARPTLSAKGKCVTGGRLDVASAWQNINNTGMQAN